MTTAGGCRSRRARFMALNPCRHEAPCPRLKMLVSLASSAALRLSSTRQSHMANLSSTLQGRPTRRLPRWELRGKRVIHSAERVAVWLALNRREVTEQATQADFDALKGHFDDGQIVEIVASIVLVRLPQPME